MAATWNSFSSQPRFEQRDPLGARFQASSTRLPTNLPPRRRERTNSPGDGNDLFVRTSEHARRKSTCRRRCHGVGMRMRHLRLRDFGDWRSGWALAVRDSALRWDRAAACCRRRLRCGRRMRTRRGLRYRLITHRRRLDSREAQRPCLTSSSASRRSSTRRSSRPVVDALVMRTRSGVLATSG
jgi:hypothetical protein